MENHNYDIFEVAKYIIDKEMEKGTSISPQRLQKLLFFLWVEYYHIYKKGIFEFDFYASKFGPRNFEIYSKYCTYGAMAISLETPNEKYEISDSDMFFIDHFLDVYSPFGWYELVIMSTQPGSPNDISMRKYEEDEISQTVDNIFSFYGILTGPKIDEKDVERYSKKYECKCSLFV